MKYRRLDEHGDMTLGNAHAYTEGAAAVEQAVMTRLRLLTLEWWEDIEDGVPYWQKVIATRDIKAAKRILQERIERTPHVLALSSFEADWDNDSRTLTVRATVESDYGVIQLNKEV